MQYLKVKEKPYKAGVDIIIIQSFFPPSILTHIEPSFTYRHAQICIFLLMDIIVDKIIIFYLEGRNTYIIKYAHGDA